MKNKQLNKLKEKSRQYLSYFIGLLLQPGQLCSPFIAKHILKFSQYTHKEILAGLTLEQKQIQHLATIRIQKELSATPDNTPDKKYIIYCGGIHNLVQKGNNIKRLAIIAESNPGDVAIGFNYSGVGNSTGYIANGKTLENDIATIINNLIKNERVAPENIVLWCHSLGSIPGTLAVHQFHKNNKKVMLYVDRGIINLAKAISNATFPLILIQLFPLFLALIILATISPLLIPINHYIFQISVISAMKITAGYAALTLLEKTVLALFLRHTISEKIEKVLHKLFEFAHWDQDNLKAFKEIDPSCKNHTQIRSPKKQKINCNGSRIRRSTGDMMVDYPNSLHAQLKITKSQRMDCSTHRLSAFPARTRTIFLGKKKSLPKSNLKTHKFTTTTDQNWKILTFFHNNHNRDPDHLITYNEETMSKHFNKFAHSKESLEGTDTKCSG